MTDVVCQMTFGGGWHGHLFPARSWPQLEWALLSRRPFYSQGKSGAVACPFRFRTGGLWASFGHYLSLKRSFLVYATMLDWVSSCDAPILSGFQLACCAATDDVMIFSTAGPGHTLAAAKRLDTGMDGIQKKAAKDINEQGLFLAMSVAGRVALAMGLLHLLDRRAISPKQLQPFLGVLQWLGLRRRSKLSVYNSVFDLVQSQIEHQIRPVPTSLTEIAAQFLLGVYWLTDLRRPFLPTLSATDASTGHGFGASVAQIPAAAARRNARTAEKQATSLSWTVVRTWCCQQASTSA